MAKRVQADFFEKTRQFAPGRVVHGGDRVRGRRKIGRPLDPRKPLHLVLRSEKARGRYSLLAGAHRLKIRACVDANAQACGVTIHRFANAGNHIHAVLSFRRRDGFRKFLRTITGLIARIVTKARRGHAFGRFWDALAFTRVIVGRRSFQIADVYVQANEIEASLGYRAREDFLRQHADSWWQINREGGVENLESEVGSLERSNHGFIGQWKNEGADSEFGIRYSEFRNAFQA